MKKLILALTILFTGFQLKAQPNHVKHIILIGCDGFGAYAIPDAKMPNLKQLINTGSWSLKARCVLPSSSAVNWASMLMGAGPTEHGYTEWNSAVPEIPSAIKSRYGLFPGIFTLIKEQKPKAKTAVIYSWQGIGPLIEKDAITFVVPGPNGDNDNFCADTAASIIIREKPLLTFIHFSEPDGTGHNIGHRTPAYYKELENVDKRIGIIINAVKKAGIANETVIIVSADHGGTGKGHGGKSLDEVQIPWIANGAGVSRGHEIKNVIITYDTAATIAWLLGLKEPQSWRGKPVIEAFNSK
ncbi:putative AlkP superfamily pyrophosphatase or phosphodiesterase [Pedobacter cryoconitis]|uniref:Putative AlkP superfamily pyrophosphatase or phosphodiesterase n=1 Tax=Pedobacter cryoconitis TaxID=188932 RepID=A0A7W8ZSM1_9SPHI|nr:alkaline phosphatase [Pedobacter cryoconitis]MBB5639432.1 putative AlkP superfamily pyrophosphatase or phosphodiesterase [Pedobacter cryoconitis]